jgi:hypothetical protein
LLAALETRTAPGRRTIEDAYCGKPGLGEFRRLFAIRAGRRCGEDLERDDTPSMKASTEALKAASQSSPRKAGMRARVAG